KRKIHVSVAVRRARTTVEVRRDPGQTARPQDAVERTQRRMRMDDVLEHRERDDPVEIVTRKWILPRQIGKHEMRARASKALPRVPLDYVHPECISTEPVVEIPGLEA